jgi:hypothetical protein
MPIDPNTLAGLASDYAKRMTSIRGRRVQRLLKREFSGAEYVLRLQFGSGVAAVLGLSTSGAAFCATDGKGKEVSVIKWRHGSTEALETRFDLLKDSLPTLGGQSLPLAALRRQDGPLSHAGSVPSRARDLLSMALKVLA